MRKIVLLWLGVWVCPAIVSEAVYAALDWDIQSGTNYITAGDDYYTVWVHNSAELNVSGGHTTYVYPDNNSTLNITGGEIYKVESRGESAISISGGDIDAIYSYDTSTVSVYGWSNSAPIPSGNSLHIVATDYSIVTIFQGNTNGQLNAYGNSTVHIYGTTFEFSPQYLTGTWADGTDFSLYMRGQFELPTQIVFHEIPEPATLLLFGLAGLGVCGFRKRKSLK